MAKFPEFRSTRLPPRVGPSVRGKIDFRTGGVEIGRAIAGAGEAIAGIALSIMAHRQQMEDARAAVHSRQLRKLSTESQDLFMLNTADTKLWEPNVDVLEKADRAALASISMSGNARKMEGAKLTEHYGVLRARTLTAATKKEQVDTFKLTSGALVDALGGGKPLDIKDATANFFAARRNRMSPDLIELEFKTLFKTGIAKRVKQLVFDKQFNRAETFLEKHQSIFDDKGVYLQRLIRTARDAATRDAKQAEVAFENYINNNMIELDNKELPEGELLKAKEKLEDEVEASGFPGRLKMRLLKSIRSWYRGEGDIDYDLLNALNERVDRVLQLGIADSTLQEDILHAKTAGKFGRRQSQANTKYQTMSRRLRQAKISRNWNAIAGTMQAFKKRVGIRSDAQQRIFMYTDDIRTALAENPTWTPAQALQYAEEQAVVHRKKKKPAVAEQFEAMQLPLVRNQKDYNALPSGTVFRDTEGKRGQKP